MARGTADLREVATPSNIDLEVLNLYRTADDVGLGEIISFGFAMAADFGRFNWPNHPDWAAILRAICYIDTDLDIRFNSGSITWEDATEFSTPGSQYLARVGSMIQPLQKAAQLSYTWQSLRRTRSEAIVADMAAARDGAVDQVRKTVLDRMFRQEAIVVSTTGNSFGWVGSTSNTYVSPDFEGSTFATLNDHYLDNGDAGYADTAAGRRSLFGDFLTQLSHHGHRSYPGGPVILLHGPLTRADVIADSQYLGAEQAFINYGTSDRAAVQGYAYGVLKDSGYVTSQIGGIPDNYFGVVKSEGLGSPRNPIRLWAPPDLGFVISLMNIDSSPPVNVSPINDLQMYLEYGAGIAQPDKGAVGQIGGGAADYVTPTIT